MTAYSIEIQKSKLPSIYPCQFDQSESANLNSLYIFIL